MSTFDNAISIHPYFKVKDGQMEACKSLLPQFCKKVASEEGCLLDNAKRASLPSTRRSHPLP